MRVDDGAGGRGSFHSHRVMTGARDGGQHLCHDDHGHKADA
jgi:hypothetical protein